MMTNKEAVLARLRGEKADWIPELWTCHKQIVFPGERYFGPDGKLDPYGTGPDAWGVMWTNMGPNPAVDGNTVAKGYKMFDNMDEWKDHVKFPPLDFMPIEQILQGMCHMMHVDREKDAVSCLMMSGTFERMNQLIGFENALCAFYEYPEEVKEFFEAMCEYKLKCIDLTYKYLKPDIIHMHDDWGTNDNMFFSPEIWREFIKPIEKRLADRIHEYGMIYMHHSCGFIKQIIPDLVEIGVDAINPVMVKNDVDYIMENYGDKITIVGGLDNQFMEQPGTTEEEIRNEVRTKMDKYVNAGRYLPFIIPNTERVLGIYADEVVKHGREMEIK